LIDDINPFVCLHIFRYLICMFITMRTEYVLQNSHDKQDSEASAVSSASNYKGRM